MVWEDDSYAAGAAFGSSDILGAVSNDGVSWTPIEIVVEDGDQTSPTIAVDADARPNRVYVAWEDTRRSVDTDIYGASSSDGGLSWTEFPMVVGGGDQRQPDLAAADGKWLLAYSAIDPYDLTDSIFYLESALDSPVRVDSSPIGTNQTSPSIIVDQDAGSVFVAWRDDTWDPGDVLLAEAKMGRSPRFGKSALVNDDRVGNTQSKPDLTLTKDGNVAVSSTDSRNGTNDIYLASTTLPVLAYQQLVKADEDTVITVPPGEPLAGMMVYIPAGAFPTDTLVKIHRIDQPPGTMPDGQFGPVVRLGPSGPGFGWPWYSDKDVTVSVPHDEALQHATDQLYVYRYSLLDGSWQQNADISNVIHGDDYSPGVHAMTFYTGHFSVFSTVGREPSSRVGGCSLRDVSKLPPDQWKHDSWALGLLLMMLALLRVIVRQRSKRLTGLHRA